MSAAYMEKVQKKCLTVMKDMCNINLATAYSLN